MAAPSTIPEASTKRISDEMFAEVERELAAAALAPATVTAVPSDKFDQLSRLLLPYVWTTAIGVWIAGLMFMNTLTPLTQCIGVGLVSIGVLSSLVFAWRSGTATNN